MCEKCGILDEDCRRKTEAIIEEFIDGDESINEADVIKACNKLREYNKIHRPYPPIINPELSFLPRRLQKTCGGDTKLTLRMAKEGYFELCRFSVGDRVRNKTTDIEYIVRAIHPNRCDCCVKEDEWWYVPWTRDWEKVR